MVYLPGEGVACLPGEGVACPPGEGVSPVGVDTDKLLAASYGFKTHSISFANLQ